MFKTAEKVNCLKLKKYPSTAIINTCEYHANLWDSPKSQSRTQRKAK